MIAWPLLLAALMLAQQANGLTSPEPTALAAGAAGTAHGSPAASDSSGQQPVTLSVDPSARSALVAEPITLTLRVDAPLGTSVVMPSLEQTLGPFSVIETSLRNDLPIDGQPQRRRWLQTLELETLESGAITIPSLEIAFRLPERLGGGESTLRSNPIAIEIGSVLGEQESPAEFRDLKQVEPLPASASPEASRLGLPAGIAAAIGALAVAVWLSTRRRPPPQYDRWALEQIESIQAEYDQRSIDIGQAYAQLSNVIRAYLEAELAIPATTQSTAELFDELPAEHCPDAARQRLQQFMTAADELKFSGSLAVANNNGVDELFESLRAVVRDTSALAAGQSAVDGEAR